MMLQSGQGIDVANGRALLASVQIASPCSVGWENMKGDDRERFCNLCQLSVYNISDMTEREAESFLRSRIGEQRTCVQLWRRADGTVMTDNCPRFLRPVRNAGRRAVSALQMLLVFLLGSCLPAVAEKVVKPLVPPPPSMEGIAGGIRAMPIQTTAPPTPLEPEKTSPGNGDKTDVSLTVRGKLLGKGRKNTTESECVKGQMSPPVVPTVFALTADERVRVEEAKKLMLACPRLIAESKLGEAERGYARAASLLFAIPGQEALQRFVLQQQARILRDMGRPEEADKLNGTAPVVWTR
jgi:hypothetical protein